MGEDDGDGERIRVDIDEGQAWSLKEEIKYGDKDDNYMQHLYVRLTFRQERWIHVNLRLVLDYKPSGHFRDQGGKVVHIRLHRVYVESIHLVEHRRVEATS